MGTIDVGSGDSGVSIRSQMGTIDSSSGTGGAPASMEMIDLNADTGTDITTVIENQSVTSHYSGDSNPDSVYPEVYEQTRLGTWGPDTDAYTGDTSGGVTRGRVMVPESEWGFGPRTFVTGGGSVELLPMGSMEEEKLSVAGERTAPSMSAEPQAAAETGADPSLAGPVVAGAQAEDAAFLDALPRIWNRTRARRC